MLWQFGLCYAVLVLSKARVHLGAGGTLDFDLSEDFSFWTQTWAAGYTALYGEPAYQDPAVNTTDGVFVWDAEYCSWAQKGWRC